MRRRRQDASEGVPAPSSDGRTPNDGHEDPELAGRLEPSTLRQRGAASLFYVMSWGFGNLVATFLGGVVLARMLGPREFGLIAVGNTVALLAGVVSEGGIASGYIRQPGGISRSVLRSVNGAQLCLSVAIATLIALIGLRFGLAGALTACMVWALPVASPQTAGRVVLMRELRFRDVSIAEAAGVASYYVWSISLVAAGGGVWALATGAIVRAAAMTLTVAAFTGWGLMVPSLRAYHDVLRVAGFGIRFSMSWLANVLYLQGQNIVIGLSSGVDTLGLWTLATRVMQVPNLIYVPLNQVAFPAFSQLLAADEDPKPLLERVASVSSAASAIVLPSFLVAMPGLIPVVFGEQWTDAWLVLPGISTSDLRRSADCRAMLAIPLRSEQAVDRAPRHDCCQRRGPLCNHRVDLGDRLRGRRTRHRGDGGDRELPARSGRAPLTGAAVWTTTPSLLATGVVASAAGFGVATALGYGVLGALAASLTAAVTATLGCAITQPTVLRDLMHIVRRSLSVVFRQGVVRARVRARTHYLVEQGERPELRSLAQGDDWRLAGTAKDEHRVAAPGWCVQCSRSAAGDGAGARHDTGIRIDP